MLSAFPSWTRLAPGPCQNPAGWVGEQ